MSAFALPRLERVIAGAGTLSCVLPELERHGCSAALIVTGPTVAASPLVDRLRDLLGPRLVGVFDGVRQHVPASTVRRLLDAIDRARADSLISVGGGSAIDTAKAAAHARLPQEIVQVAVPTTLSAGEFTEVAGVTDDATRVKRALADARIAPRSVVADPEATLATPDAVWAASGIRALDHAIESLYSRRHHPLSDALAERAITMLRHHLPSSLQAAEEARIRHRGECQMAAWLAVFGVTNAGFGLSHALGHQVGPRWHVLHGVTSAIMLPHAMHFMAEAAPDRFAPIARALDVPFRSEDPAPAAHACAERVADFIAPFGLPMRLRDAGVPRDGLGEIAAHVAGVMARAAVVERAVTARDIEALLAAAY